MVRTICVGGLILCEITIDEIDSLSPSLSEQFSCVDLLYYQSLKYKSLKTMLHTFPRSIQKICIRLTMEFEINFKNDPRLHTHTYVRCSGRKRYVPYREARPLTSRRTIHDIFVMEGMPIPSMHVATSEAAEIKWVCDQITRENLPLVRIAVIAKKQQYAKLRRILEKNCIPINNKVNEGIFLLSEPEGLPANIATLFWLDATEENVFPNASSYEKSNQIRIIKKRVSGYIFVSKVGWETNFSTALINQL